MKDKVSFADLPIEIANHVCTLLEQDEVSRLARTAKPIYCLIRPILYRHPKIDSFPSLVLFQRTIVKATWMGAIDHKWSTQGCIDQAKSLDLTVDPSRDRGSQLSAVIISRVLKAIVQRCPSVDITLRFAHCRCDISPISVLENEEFPRVRRLLLYVGKYDTEETHLRQRSGCSPSAKFFRPFVSGLSFPDLKELEVRHYWATAPPANASIDIDDRNDLYRFDLDCHELIMYSDGLGKLESITLESPPELNSGVFMQLVGNPKAAASNLTTLDLRFCQLDQATIAQLLYHAPPKLKRLSLFLRSDSFVVRGSHRRLALARTDTSDTHLCPLIRQYSKRLERLDYGAKNVCRQLFFDDDEILAMQENGINTKNGGRKGEDIESKKLDVHAIEQTIQTARQHRRGKGRDERIKKALLDLDSSSKTSDSHPSLETSTRLSAAKGKAQRDMEALLDEEEAQRHRLINGSSTKWSRRIIALGGLCEPGDTWAEMKIAADMEERGVHWVLASKSLQVASWHTSGELSVPLNYQQAVEENFKMNRG